MNDFRKICRFEAYAPTDNVAELTARTNDNGWATVFAEWLKGSRLSDRGGLVIAGRIADSGMDPMPHMREAKGILAGLPRAELLSASVREALNIYQADEWGCEIVTVPHEILNKAQQLAGVALKDLSLDTVKMFATDPAGAELGL